MFDAIDKYLKILFIHVYNYLLFSEFSVTYIIQLYFKFEDIYTNLYIYVYIYIILAEIPVS